MSLYVATEDITLTPSGVLVPADTIVASGDLPAAILDPLVSGGSLAVAGEGAERPAVVELPVPFPPITSSVSAISISVDMWGQYIDGGSIPSFPSVGTQFVVAGSGFDTTPGSNTIAMNMGFSAHCVSVRADGASMVCEFDAVPSIGEMSGPRTMAITNGNGTSNTATMGVYASFG